LIPDILRHGGLIFKGQNVSEEYLNFVLEAQLVLEIDLLLNLNVYMHTHVHTQ
jgi:hypothetical protein